MAAPPRTNQDYHPRKPGSGSDYVVDANAPEETLRYWVEGDAYPRLVLDPANHDVLAGNGTVPPISLVMGTGAPANASYVTMSAEAGLSNETTLANVIRRDVLASRGAFGNPGVLFGATDTGIGYRDSGAAWDPYFAVLDGSGKVNVSVLPPIASTLATLTDVDLTGLVDLDLIQYSAGASKWLRIPASSIGGTSYTAGTGLTLAGTVFSITNVGPGATGPLGSATTVPVVTINARGQVSALTSAAIQIAESAVTNLTADLAARMTVLTPTAVKTANYTAAANELVPCDTTGGSFTVTLPSAPADKSMVLVKQIIRGGTFTVSVACGGTDTFNRTGGGTTGTLTLSAQAMWMQYKSSNGVWYVLADDIPLSQLDLRFQPLDSDLTDIAALAPPDDDVLQRKAGAWTGRTMSQLATDLGIPASLSVLLGSIMVPRRSLDRFRGAPNGVDTQLAANITSTDTTITTNNINLARVGEYPVIQIGSEQMQVIRGQNTATLIVIRHVNGTTAAAHTAGDAILRDKVRNVIAFGDSTAQNTISSVTGEWDGWVGRVRRIFNERFGGSLGAGFHGLWRNAHSTGQPNHEWDLAGTWFLAAQTTAAYHCGPWDNYFGSSSSEIATFTPRAKMNAGQIDVWYVVFSSGAAGVGTRWSYSTDGGATWVNNPGTDVDVLPTNTTTLAAADTGRRCDYWTGTQTMTLAATTGFASNAGFVLVDVGSGTTFKARALFTYDGVSGATLTNVKYVGPSQYNALTTVTGDVVQQRPELRKASIAVTDPATFKIRCANAAGTGSTSVIAGIDIWSSVPVFGTTRGVKLHNMGYDANTLAKFSGCRTITDVGTTNASATMTALRGAFTSADVGSQVINANVPAGTIITAVGSGTSVTLSANATATVTAGSAQNPTTIQGMRGGWDRSFNGCPASLLPDLIIMGCFTNEMGMDSNTTNIPNGADGTMVATFVSGSPNVTITSGDALEASDQGAYVYAGSTGTITPFLTKILTFTDATHFVMNQNAGSSISGQAISVCVPDTTLNTALKTRLDILYGGGIGGTGVSLYADELIVVPFEQGVARLLGLASTAAYQVSYRQAFHDWATTNRQATLDIYQAWSAEGNTGYSAAVADGLMDTGDTSGFHEGPTGYRDMASRITRLLEFA